MTPQARLLQDLHQAIRDRNAPRESAIRLVRAAIANEEIARQRELDEEEALAVIPREVRKHKESLSEFEKAGREDLAAEERAQLEALAGYLPAPMSRDEIALAAEAAVAEAHATTLADLGSVMRILMPRLDGRADGGVANQIVRELLSRGRPDEA